MANRQNFLLCSRHPFHGGPVSLAQYLINIPGVSGSEGAILSRLQYILRHCLGMRIQRIPVNNQSYCLFARFRAPQLVMSSHVDTVSPYFPARIHQNNVYGRGACDTRGIIAAMLSAGHKLLKQGNRRFGFLFVTGEEHLHEGAKAAAEYPTTSHFLVNGEPTDCSLATGSKGALRAIISTHGIPCHSSAPDQGRSAINILLDILQDIRGHIWPQDPYFGGSLVNIGRIDGGEMANVLARSARALLMFRLACPSKTLKKELKRLVAGRGDIEYISEYEPLRCAPLDGFSTNVAGFGTDLPYMKRWGVPYLYGPGSILDAHTDHEKVPIAQLHQAVRDYQRIVRTLTGRC